LKRSDILHVIGMPCAYQMIIIISINSIVYTVYFKSLCYCVYPGCCTAVCKNLSLVQL